ncbi:MAG TPA: hypothetical protein VJU61_13505 [Polyangiaceae bacterium]|nr:hypothetical protein [Polyangiaceae bacterium]
MSLAGLVQASVVLAMLLFRTSGSHTVHREPPPRVMRIAVKPVLDAELLHKGSQPQRAAKLPDMWKPPDPARRVEPKPTPPPEVKKISEASPDEPCKPEDKPLTPQQKRVDDLVKKMQAEAAEQEPKEDEPNLPDEGGADGVEEGKEKDPLKARAVDVYQAKLINWFKQGFTLPLDELDCATLVGLSAKVSARIGPGREVTGYSMESSGNPIFDARVRLAMEGRVGEVVPPPPPNYPELLEPVVHPTFQGKNEKCN